MRQESTVLVHRSNNAGLGPNESAILAEMRRIRQRLIKLPRGHFDATSNWVKDVDADGVRFADDMLHRAHMVRRPDEKKRARTTSGD
jgi:hypothetical protein